MITNKFLLNTRLQLSCLQFTPVFKHDYYLFFSEKSVIMHFYLSCHTHQNVLH